MRKFAWVAAIATVLVICQTKIFAQLLPLFSPVGHSEHGEFFHEKVLNVAAIAGTEIPVTIEDEDDRDEQVRTGADVGQADEGPDESSRDHDRLRCRRAAAVGLHAALEQRQPARRVPPAALRR